MNAFMSKHTLVDEELNIRNVFYLWKINISRAPLYSNLLSNNISKSTSNNSL